MKKFAIIFLALVTLAILAFGWLSTASGKKFKALNIPKTNTHNASAKALLLKLQLRSKEAKTFVARHGYNEDFYFLIDMSLPSGQDRFFIYDSKNERINAAGLVTHGRCNEPWLEGRKYNNVVGGGCTSLGKYKIGYPYQGRFGLAFKLHGLEESNDKAFERFVVLHSHACVPEDEVKTEICQSDGCPTVSPDFLKKLDPMIRTSQKPVLLWIFE